MENETCILKKPRLHYWNRFKPIILLLLTVSFFVTKYSEYSDFPGSWREERVTLDQRHCSLNKGGYGNSRREANKTVRQVNPNAPCSLETIRSHVLNNDFFPKKGTWKKDPFDNTTQFVPEVCKFSSRRYERELLKKCLSRSKNVNFLLLGDSNGRRYYNALRELFSSFEEYSCTTIKEEKPGSLMPDATYLSSGTAISKSEIVVHSRNCISCKGSLSNCTNKSSNRTAMIEYMAMEYLLDTEVSTRRSAIESNTNQEVIFTEYLKDSAHYPDVIIIFGNSHDLLKNSVDKVRADMTYLIKLLERSVPLDTVIIWVTVHAHYKAKLPEGQRYIHWDELAEINQAWLDVLKPVMAREDSNMRTFFDLQFLSKDVLPMWIADLGVHLQKDWYSRIMSYILQTLCN